MKKLAVPIPEFCDSIGCGRSTGYELIRRGEVTAVKLGRKTVVTVASIEAMLDRNSVVRPTEQDDSVSQNDFPPAECSDRGRCAMSRLACNARKQMLAAPK
ncbi:helix-turn-helix domain-containing protein [Sphingomonas sp. PB4P5]|uniref:helix-turn-helix domain-containing protein n=1 Tax=Parasphingomonas puruogangriensis TaxID=3096155 RepID=UPI002FC8D7BB